MSDNEVETVGAESRKAALTMVDAVLRRGQRFDALPAHGLAPSDEGLARAIAGEVFRHLTDLDHLREGIGLQAYAQVDPVVAYKREAFQMYSELMDAIRSDTVKAPAARGGAPPPSMRAM